VGVLALPDERLDDAQHPRRRCDKVSGLVVAGKEKGVTRLPLVAKMLWHKDFG